MLSLPEANGYYICLLLFRGRGKLQESNALLKTGKVKTVTADGKLTASSEGSNSTVDLSHKCSEVITLVNMCFERNVDGLMVAVCQCLY